MLTIEASPELEARYEALQHCPDKSLGRGFWDFYKRKGFTFPGVVGSVNHAVAHHDWIHVLADYDSDGKYTMYIKQLTWPLNRVWNIDISGSRFNEYLNDLKCMQHYFQKSLQFLPYIAYQ